MVEKGSFVELDYTGSTGGKVFDTTLEETGKKEGFKRRGYRPIIIKVGAGEVIKGLDEELEKMKEGDEKKLKIPPEKGYGQRNPDLVKLVPLKVFKENNINPVPGMVLNLDNLPARIQSVSGGRVRVDFNHELAGKELEFDIKVKKVIKKKEDVIKALSKNIIPEAEVSVKGDETRIKIKEVKKEYQDKKEFLLKRLFSAVDGIKKVTFEETYEEPPAIGKNI